MAKWTIRKQRSRLKTYGNQLVKKSCLRHQSLSLEETQTALKSTSGAISP